jgi:hypothetical protein
MEEPTHFNCPHCTYAFPPNDPRVAVPPGQKNRVLDCPGCRSPIRVWAAGAGPKPGGSMGCWIVVALIVAALLFLVARS